MKAKQFKTVNIAVSAVILAIVLALNIAVGVFSGAIDKFVIGYKEGSGSDASRAEGAALSEQIQGEGTVLVKNTKEDGNPLLPLKLADAPKVNVFGWSATDWVISGSGSGQVKNSYTVDGVEYPIDLLDALTEAGIEYNTEITKMYESFYANREFSENGGGINGAQANAGALKSFNYEFSRLYEPSIEDQNYYSSSLLANAEAYSDTAIVAIGRVSGESNDSPKVQYKRTTKGGTLVEDTERTYLEISTEEEALLNYVAGTYKNVIVLINTTNVMELGFMDEIKGLDACLVVATTGSTGARAIPKLIYSDIEDKDGNIVSINPSGKLVDTYAYDLSTSSTYVDVGSGNETVNFYSNALYGSGLYPTTVQHTNGSTNVRYEGVAYTDYREGIYMGYKWYETADTMKFWDSDYAKNKWGISKGYEDVVQYPFGYGLSYTEFEWEITYLEQTNGSTLNKDDIIKVGVNVTNVGGVAGQDVVELYYTAPYTEGGVEKASVNLAAFGKTQKVLAPNESEYVELVFNVSDMASYDCYNLSGSVGNDGGYILEEGDYTLTLRTDAHTLAGDKVVGGDDTLTYKIANDTPCKEEAVNRFTGEDAADGVAIDGNSDHSADITYLSRANFANTFPGEKSEPREMTEKIRALNLYNQAMATEWDAANPAEDIVTGDTTQGGEVGAYETRTDEETGKDYEVYVLNDLGMALGKNYNDSQWEGVLNRITLEEMHRLTLHGYTKTQKVDSINKPKTLDLDGPNQIGSFSGGIDPNKTGFSSIVLAQTWNLELAYSMGLAFGRECATVGANGWYGPGVNPHRSPFGGRNYEYYSEDVLMSGLMCARVVAAAKNRGVFCYLKHICLYESESGRDSMYNWLTEQSLREIYLKPFEIAVKEGGSNAMMTSYGRIGAVWTGGSSALLNDLVRGEWGFQGAFLTDYTDHPEFMNGDQMLRNGGDLWMDGWQDTGKLQFSGVVYSGTYSDNGNPEPKPTIESLNAMSNPMKKAMRTATKNILFMWLNTMATNQEYNEGVANGTIKDTIVIPVSPELNFRWYIPVVIVVDVVAVVGCGLWIFLGLKKKDDSLSEE